VSYNSEVLGSSGPQSSGKNSIEISTTTPFWEILKFPENSVEVNPKRLTNSLPVCIIGPQPDAYEVAMSFVVDMTA